MSRQPASVSDPLPEAICDESTINKRVQLESLHSGLIKAGEHRRQRSRIVGRQGLEP